MTPPTRAKVMYPALILAAEMLVVLAFYLITEDAGRGPVAWLNLAVCMVVLLVDTSVILLFSRPIPEFSAKIPSIAILWFLDAFYTAAALGIMLCSWQLAIEFRFQLLAQLAILLVACGVVLTSMHATEHAANVENEERGLFANLHTLRDGMKSLMAQMSRLPIPSALTEKMSRCAEDVRYMAPSKNERALELDSQLLRVIHETETCLTNQSLAQVSEGDLRDSIAKLLEELTFLIQQRKACGIE